MPTPLDRCIAWLHSFARRWPPEIFVRVTRRGVEQAEETLSGLSDEEIEEGREAARRAIQEPADPTSLLRRPMRKILAGEERSFSLIGQISGAPSLSAKFR